MTHKAAPDRRRPAWVNVQDFDITAVLTVTGSISENSWLQLGA